MLKIILGIILAIIVVSVALILKDEKQERKVRVNFLLTLFFVSVSISFLLFDSFLSLYKLETIITIGILILTFLLTMLTAFCFLHFNNVVEWNVISIKTKICGIIFAIFNTFLFAFIEHLLIRITLL